MATAVAVAVSNVGTPIIETRDDVMTSAGAEEQAAPADHGRIWLWVFLAAVVASQFYFVRELVGAFALFAIAFVAIATVVVTLYMLVKCAQLCAARLAALRQPAMELVRIARHSRKAA